MKPVFIPSFLTPFFKMTVFEVEETKLNANLKVIKEKMENAYPELLVPLSTTM
jgi:DNA polymerase I-like protein with 3'-5' exonuclease and polymerase domains